MNTAGVMDDLCERLDAGLEPAVSRLVDLLHELRPSPPGATDDAAARSLYSNLSAVIEEMRTPLPGAAPRLPCDAADWPRELAARACPESLVLDGYVACGDSWWRDDVLPELFVTSASDAERLAAAQRTVQVVSGYARDVGRQAVGEFRATLGGLDAAGFERVLAAAGQEELALLVSRTIGPLVDGPRRDPVLVRTLTQWFDSLCCNVTTARRLGIHRNTLLYRFHKIEDLLGHSLDRDRLDLELALRALERLRNGGQ
jgi:PucR-like helix-turn-helix protein